MICRRRREGFWRPGAQITLALLPLPSAYLPPILEVGPLDVGRWIPSWGVCGSAVSSHSWVWGKAPAANKFGSFWGPRNATDGICACFYEHHLSFHAHPCLNSFVYFVSQKYRTPFSAPLSAGRRGICPLSLPAASVICREKLNTWWTRHHCHHWPKHIQLRW